MVRDSDGRLAGVPAAHAIEIATPVVRALECAHAQGIIHRDLKPSNVMMCDSGVIKVLDFGVAKLFDSREVVADAATVTRRDGRSELTEPGDVMGTVLYMSPEQWGLDEVDHRSDIWAVGLILF